MEKIKLLELFGGIGACTQAFKRLGIPFEIADYVEIDKYAVKSYNAINDTNFEPQDITKWNKDIEVDFIMHGSPCQDFSIAGKQAGGDKDSGTRSSLMYETIRIVNKIKPKYVIWENVKNLLSKKHKHNFDKYIEILNEGGYNSYYQVLNAKDYGIPQNRERVYTISIRKDIDNGSFKFPEKQELKLKLKDMLEDEVDEKYYLSDKNIIYAIENFDNEIKVRNLKEQLCDYLVQSNQVKENDMVRHSYSSWRAKQEFHTENSKNNNISATLTTRPDTLGIAVRNATKGGYAIATNGDSVNLAYPNSKTRRGRVGKEVSQTLMANDSMGVVEKTRKDIKEIQKYCEYCGKQLYRKRFNGRLEDFTVFNNRKYCNRECMKRAYLKIGENNQTYSNAHTTARKINELILHKEVCELCGSNNNLDIHHIDGNWNNNNLDNLMCLCRSCHTKYEKNKDKIGDDEPMDIRLRIRKLTPKECWRL